VQPSALGKDRPLRKIDPDNFRRATRDTPREVNRRILLNLVREREPISRADLARAMGVARGTITALVNELIADGLIREGETADAPRGRKPTLLHIRAHDRLAIGIDVRLGTTSVLLTDFSGRDLAREAFETPGDPDGVVAEIIDRVTRIAAEHDGVGGCQGLGVVVPGVVNGNGRIMNAPTLGWTDLDIRTALQAAFEFPVHIERDAVACALAWMWLGDHSDTDLSSFVYLVVSQGVGTGIVVNGQVVRGSQYSAGEFGHVPLNVDGPLCSCGSHGCLEAYTSDTVTIERYRKLADPADAGPEITVADIVTRARGGEGPARDVVRETGRHIGVGIASVINVVNPGTVIVGGEVARAWNLIEPLIREEVRTRTLTKAAGNTPIRPDTDHPERRLRGATALVMAPLFAAPQIA
jgi:N-acetylglucosamine repressor